MTIDITEETITKMAEAFCTWELPESVLPDECVMCQDTYRTGTNIFTVDEAEQAVKFMFDSLKGEKK